MDRNKTIVIGLLGAGLLAACCVAILAVGVGGWVVWETTRAVSTSVSRLPTESFGTGAPATRPPTTAGPPLPTAPAGATPVPGPAGDPGETLALLAEAEIPPSDLRELAMRFHGIPDIPVTVSNTPADHPIGHVLEFNASSRDTNTNFKLTARLVYKTENVYFFADEDVRVDEAAVKELVDDFQENTYPTTREFFGSEWSPGVDGDPRLYILYAGGLGLSTLGYYSSADEYSRLAHEYSNEKEMFYINADLTGPGEDMASTLAHEFQHMIHWNYDRNEETWLNEGAAVLGQFLNGYPAGFDYAFASQPDLQLNYSRQASEEYGAGFLFLAYFLDRFGPEASQALVADAANGLQSVDQVLAEQSITDSATGKPLTAVDVFADWVVANYLGDPAVADGRYEYHNYPDAPTIFFPTNSYFACPVRISEFVHQFGADYYEIDCGGPVTIRFSGATHVPVVPSTPHSGRYAFWSHRNDESDTRLTRDFNLSGLTSATLEYWIWHQIEQDYDYVYLTVSTDGGQTWDIIETPSGTDEDITGNNFGWGYTGNSGGGDPASRSDARWLFESVDLSAYAGQNVLVRFEYVTDAAVNYAGLLVDDISVPELNYSTDFESDDGGWQAEGFVRMDNVLSQGFVVQVIRQGRTGAETTVERLALDGSNTGSLAVELGPGERAVLVVSGTTPFTTELAAYAVEVFR